VWNISDVCRVYFSLARRIICTVCRIKFVILFLYVERVNCYIRNKLKPIIFYYTCIAVYNVLIIVFAFVLWSDIIIYRFHCLLKVLCRAVINVESQHFLQDFTVF